SWVFVSIEDASEVLGLLRDLAPDWRPIVDRIGGAAPASIAPEPLVAAVPSAPPDVPSSVPPAPSPVAARVPSAPAAPPPPPPPPEPPKPLVFEEPGSPQPGRLDQDAIV